MPAITPTTTFGPLSGTIQLSLLDGNFSQLATAINTLGIINASSGITTGPPIAGTMLTVAENIGATALSLTNCAIDAIGSVNSYLQTDVHNSSNGLLSSSDMVATADTGSDTSQYIDVGINSSGFASASWTISGALDAYMYASDGNLTVGTGGASKSLIFHTGGLLAANIRGTITSAGNWTINAPTSGNTLAIGAFSGAVGAAISYASGGGFALTSTVASGNTTAIRLGQTGIVNWDISNVATTGAFTLYNGTTNVLSISSGGNAVFSGQVGFNGASGTAQQTGWGTPTGAAIVANYPGASATLVQTSNAVAALIGVMKVLGIYGT